MPSKTLVSLVAFALTVSATASLAVAQGARGRETIDLSGPQGLFELYVDDVLMETFFAGPVSGKLGWLAENADVSVSSLRCWRMHLD